MTGTSDTTKPYENQRERLGELSLGELRISMMQSQGLSQNSDPILQRLNGSSNTHLTEYLVREYQREPIRR